MREIARRRRVVFRKDSGNFLVGAAVATRGNMQFRLALSPLSQPSPVKGGGVRRVEGERVGSVEDLEFDID
jgi:hypothetical protein